MSKYIASVSFGKDSLAMLLMLFEKEYPLDEVVFYDTGKEFQAIYNLRDKVVSFLQPLGVKYTELYPSKPFDYLMFEKPVRSRATGKVHKYGYSWCGGTCRWGTTEKLNSLEKHAAGAYEYIGIAVDEQHRAYKMTKGNKLYPLIDWGMTEKNCLEYCYSRGYNWNEDGVELYSVLDRVSCWCCANKNLKELKGIYLQLPKYWEMLKDTQSRLDRPMKKSGTVFQLEERFRKEINMTGAPGYMREVERLQVMGNSPPVEVKEKAQPEPVKQEAPYTWYSEELKSWLTSW